MLVYSLLKFQHNFSGNVTSVLVFSSWKLKYVFTETSKIKKCCGYDDAVEFNKYKVLYLRWIFSGSWRLWLCLVWVSRPSCRVSFKSVYQIFSCCRIENHLRSFENLFSLKQFSYLKIDYSTLWLREKIRANTQAIASKIIQVYYYWQMRQCMISETNN